MNMQPKTNVVNLVTEWLSVPKYRKKLWLFVILFPIALGLMSLGKYIYYTGFTNVNELRESVGKQVLYKGEKLVYRDGRFVNDPHGELHGTLTECFYKIDDKWGFFSLRVNVEGTQNVINDGDGNVISMEGGGGISTLLEPWEINKITVLP